MTAKCKTKIIRRIALLILLLFTTTILLTACKYSKNDSSVANTIDSNSESADSTNSEDSNDSADNTDESYNADAEVTDISQNQEIAENDSQLIAEDSCCIADNDVIEETGDTAVNENDTIIYTNDLYGFEITLPASWKGYTVLEEDWQGIACSGDQQGEVVETGPKLIIRHPDWTNDNPRQDIPIMVFTPDQWKLVENEEIAVSAAPVGPSKLTSNSDYVFALPARYNFAYQTGFEEVEKIISDNFYQ